MIHYQLRCADGHGFDGWFKDSAGFEHQAAAGLIACPECGTTHVRRGLMAPALNRKGRSRDAARDQVIDQNGAPQPGASTPGAPQPGASTAGAPTPGPASASPQPAAPDARAGAVLPDQVRAMLQRLRAEVERNCENVGPSFAQEARRIHNGESEQRGIYGETSPEEAQALADDGIDVARLPWIPRADS